jgi:hypothetical protein
MRPSLIVTSFLTFYRDEQEVQSHEHLHQVVTVVPLLPHCLQRPRTQGDRDGQLDGPGIGLRVLLHTLRRRASSAVATSTAPTSVGTTESSNGHSPSCPHPNNDGKGKSKGKWKVKNNGSTNNNRGSNAPDVALLLQSLDRHHLDVARDAPSSAAGVSTSAHHTCYMAVLRRPRWPSLHAPTDASTTPVAGYDFYLVTLEGRVGSTVIGQLLQYHGLHSPGGHRLGR